MVQESITRYEFTLMKDGIDAQLLEIKKSLEAMWLKIDGRPSWATLIIITFLSSLVVGLTVLLLKGGL